MLYSNINTQKSAGVSDLGEVGGRYFQFEVKLRKKEDMCYKNSNTE